jgi:hypothetical protein
MESLRQSSFLFVADLPMNAAFRLSCVAIAMGLVSVATANEAPCALCETPCAQRTCVVQDGPPSWIFRRSNYTHDPETGARVAQYQRLPAIEPLDDERLVTSRYHRTRTNLRGTGGSQETYYEVQSWGNGRGGIDAEWERFHDAWKESYLQGGFYNQGPGYGNGYPGQFGYGAPGYGNGYQGYGFPGNGFPGAGFNQGPYWGNQGQWQGNNGHDHHGDHGDDHHGDGGHDGGGH